MSATPVRPCESDRRSGFTLLETLIALGLTAVIMMLVGSLLASFARIDRRSRQTVADLEITRSLQRQLQDDLDQLVWIANEPASPAAVSSDVTITDNALPGFGSLPAADIIQEIGAPLPKASMFSGSRDQLQFLILSSEPDVPAAADGAGQPNGGEPEIGEDQYLVVEYERRTLSQSENTTRAAGDGAKSPLAGEEPREPFAGPDPGLTWVRSVTSYDEYQRLSKWSDSFDASALKGLETIEVGTAARRRADLKPRFAGQRDVIAEIDDVAFRYFDGRAWTTAWEAQSGQPFPVAVEMSFTMAAPQPDGQAGRSTTGTGPVGDGVLVIEGAESAESPALDDRPVRILGDTAPPGIDGIPPDPDRRRIVVQIGAGHSMVPARDDVSQPDFYFEQGSAGPWPAESEMAR